MDLGSTWDMRESQVKAQIKKRLKASGWLVVDTSLRSAQKQLRGLPDLLCWRRDHFVMLEVKRQGGAVQDSQVQFLSLVAPHLGNHVYHRFVDHPDGLPPWMTEE